MAHDAKVVVLIFYIGKNFIFLFFKKLILNIKKIFY